MATKDEQINDAMVEAAIDTMRSAAPGKVSAGTLEQIEAEGTDKKDVMGGAFEEEPDALVTIYNRYTGVSSRVLVSMLSKTLRKRFDRDDIEIPASMHGERVFSMAKPTGTQEPETHLCMFHEDSKMRAEVEAAGVMLRCRKENIATEADVVSHAENRHPSAFRAVMVKREKTERDEERDYNRQMMETLVKILKDRDVK